MIQVSRYLLYRVTGPLLNSKKTHDIYDIGSPGDRGGGVDLPVISFNWVGGLIFNYYLEGGGFYFLEWENIFFCLNIYISV